MGWLPGLLTPDATAAAVLRHRAENRLVDASVELERWVASCRRRASEAVYTTRVMTRLGSTHGFMRRGLGGKEPSSTYSSTSNSTRSIAQTDP